MKAVLISIQPQPCELIASGKKTIEVRKTAPKLQTPFKCYIYQTKKKWIYRLLEKLGLYQGKVIGEFVCDRIGQIEYQEKYFAGLTSRTALQFFADKIKSSCLTLEELNAYGKGETLYGWHISDLEIYDKPKELGEFYTHSLGKKDSCNTCENYPTKENGIDYLSAKCNYCKKAHELFVKKLTRPPQSWCYVED